MCLAIEEMRRESRMEGEQRGEQQGRQKGISLMNSLISTLMDMDRLDDLRRASHEPEYREELIKELFPDAG
jgi:predicted transposase YdaD